MKKGIILSVIFIVLTFTSVQAYAEEAQSDVQLDVIVDTDQVVRTNMFNLVLNASGLDDLYTIRLELRYDPARLELDQTSIQNLAWDSNQNGYAAVELDAATGAVDIIYSKKGKVPGVNGDKNLIGLQFKTLRIGMTTVEIRNVELVNSKGNIIKVSAASITKEINILPNPLNVSLTGNIGLNDWYISNVTVEVSDLDANVIYYLLDGVQYSYTQPFSISTIGKHTLKIITDDGYGYMKEKEASINIDYNCPILTADIENMDWQNKDIRIMPNYDDRDGSGISQSWYQWTNTTDQPAGWEQYNQEELIQPEEGIWYLHTKAVDVAGNVNQAVFGPYKLDKTIPEITVDIDKQEIWESKDITVTPVFTDEGGSSIQYMGYQWSHEKTTPTEYTTYTSGSLLQVNDGAWYLHLLVKDGAGNTKAITCGPYMIDKTSPTINADIMNRDWGNTDICVTPAFKDEGGSQIKYMGYQWSNEQSTPAVYTSYTSGSLLQQKEGIWYLYLIVEDWAGNKHAVTYGPYKLDKTVPVIAVDLQERDWANIDVSVTPEFTDEGGSQIQYTGYQWSLNQEESSEYNTYTSGSLEQTNDGSWYLHLIVKDWAGNTSTMTYAPYKIDKSAPVIEFSGVTEGMDYTDTLIPVISIADAVSGIQTQSITLDGQPYISGTPVTKQGPHTITAAAADFGGNNTTKTITFKVYAATALTLDIPQVEYSDLYSINATLNSYSQAVSGAAISITINGENMGAFYTDADGKVVLNGITLYSAGIYTVDAIYLQDDSRYYRGMQNQSGLIVIPEKNNILYTGDYQVQYPGILTVSAAVNQENDGYPGDISLARFNVDIIRQNYDGSSTMVDNLIMNCDLNGVISSERNYGIGVYTVVISLLNDGYYAPGTYYITIPVYQEGKGDVSCGGWLLLPDPSTGQLTKVTCNFNVKYKPGGADGTFKLFYEQAGININDGNITWLVLDGNTAQFQGTNGIYTYRLACIDDKNKDYITLRIWNGTDTSVTPVLEIINVEQDGGNVNVKDK